MNSISLALVMMLASCGSSVEVHASGDVEGTRTFHFRNSVSVTVESANGSFEWRDHDVRNGKENRAPYSELRVEIRSGGFCVTDRALGKGKIRINGVVHEGIAFRLRDDGSVEDASWTGGFGGRIGK